jgi:molybdopterin-containing oxidoreductase family iron-sulfur binding subunit
MGERERPAQWRSLDEYDDTPAFRALLEREFPRQAAVWPDGLDRRDFLRVMGASLGLAGLGACTRQPAEQIAPYVDQPEVQVPGQSLYFATATAIAGVGLGLLVESREGRPIKVEGNPDHPASLGATDMQAQALVLSLYDPARARSVTRQGEAQPYAAFIEAAQSLRRALLAARGAGLRVLTGPTTSPTLLSQIADLLAELPLARWHVWNPVAQDAVDEGARLVFGEPLHPIYHIDRADRIVSLDADFLSCGPAHLQHVRGFAARRRPETGRLPMLRLYVAESWPTVTGAKADHLLSLPPAQIRAMAHGLAARLGVPPSAYSAAAAAEARPQGAWLDAAAADLMRHRGACLVLPGEYQPAEVHALCHAMNHALSNIGATVTFTAPLAPTAPGSLRELAAEMAAGQVEVLLILDANPVYTAPADLDFAALLGRVRHRLHLSPYFDETSALCQWHVPQAHELESWGDIRAFDGTVTIQQPLIRPLYQGRSVHEVLAAFSAAPLRTGYEIVRAFWQGRLPGPGFEDAFRQALERGTVPGTALPPLTPVPRPAAVSTPPPAPAPAGEGGMTLLFRPDPVMDDGRFSTNAWLQEKPKQLSHITWDNVAMISPATAARLGVRVELEPTGGAIEVDVVELRYRGRALRAPAWVMPGQPDGCVTLTLGYGRRIPGTAGDGVGYNAYALRTADAPWGGRGLEVRRTGARHRIACTQLHHAISGNELVRAGTLTEYRARPRFIHEREHGPPKLSLYPEYAYPGYAWAMSIDMTTCTGCGACVIACQAENNIPVVGKQQVLRGREMHWLRVDAYYRGSPEAPTATFMPVPCMHCEKAPCELVCPVAATVHDAEGLNAMVYNRCIGTRYCSNNCPYKVRRFNFLRYADFFAPPALRLLPNPEVTVRSRGVMEKCTYCVQRIVKARTRAELEDRRLRDGEVRTACQAACPAEAIVFGDMNDPAAQVHKLKALPRSYGLLAELGTQPRTTYLAEIRNPNPAIKDAGAAGGRGA